MPLAQVAKILRLSEAPLEEVIDVACRVLSSGGILALPTDTIYGLTTTLEHSKKLYSLKRRSCTKPLGIFVPSAMHVHHVADCSVVPESLLQSLLPGPVTLLFKRKHDLPAFFNPNVEEIGVRVPDLPLVQLISNRLGVPLAQTSANISGEKSPVRVEDFEHLWNKLDLVIDGLIGCGNTASGSTVVDLSRTGEFRIVREGCALEPTRVILLTAGLKECTAPNL